MSEKFNQDLSLSGKIPSDLFNAMFDFKGCWQKDATAAKNLAFDGWFITLYNVELEKTNITLSERVKQEVPTTWDPAAIAELIEKYGTHVVVGVKMGAKDVIHEETYMPWELQGVLAGSTRPSVDTCSKNNDIMNIYIRRGGIDFGQSHSQWLSTISQSPNVISLAFSAYYFSIERCSGKWIFKPCNKPQIEELHVFLEFQLPRQWAPVYGDLPLGLKRRKQASPSLQFTFMGPKLYVNTARVDTGNRPVTGIRLYLEGKKSDQLAIHLQHLSTLPTTFQLSDDLSYGWIDEPERGYLEPVKWSMFSHVCTVPVHYSGSHFDDTAPIVTKAWFDVKVIGMRKVLFLRLGFSMATSARIRRSEWDGPSTQSRKSGILSMLISTRRPTSPPKAPKMTNFVDTKEMVRGPEDRPGYWVVTGAKLCVEGGRISIRAKYTLVTLIFRNAKIDSHLDHRALYGTEIQDPSRFMSTQYERNANSLRRICIVSSGYILAVAGTTYRPISFPRDTLVSWENDAEDWPCKKSLEEENEEKLLEGMCKEYACTEGAATWYLSCNPRRMVIICSPSGHPLDVS
ncbi:MACPF domain-containing protein NSL1 [Hibiscus syriacus]|uniref:MACPF domain-containing protein NSL1 n=1 Tax=Hibiscus syriacus TaxID=106335 RepID=A0A6A3AUJ9_HIBSY|nr:MACPF domain-containing protein NSL1 [Hibiscus syriacus]